jgi:hypothetical protein
MLPAIAVMIGAQFLMVEMGFCKLFCLDWPQIVVLPISASQVVRIIGVSPAPWIFKTGTLYVAQAGLKLTICLPFP